MRNINPLLWKAIDEARMIRLRYKDRERIVEPHDYGVRKGKAMLLAYQVAGSSSHTLPAWRWMEEDLISDIELLNRAFPVDGPAHRRTPSMGRVIHQSQTRGRIMPRQVGT